MEPARRRATPGNPGTTTTGGKAIAFVFACILAVLVLAGVWVTSEIGSNDGPPPTTTAPN